MFHINTIFGHWILEKDHHTGSKPDIGAEDDVGCVMVASHPDQPTNQQCTADLDVPPVSMQCTQVDAIQCWAHVNTFLEYKCIFIPLHRYVYVNKRFSSIGSWKAVG